MTILAIDLGKFGSVACVYETESGTHRFEKVATRPGAMHDLVVNVEPARVVIEVGSSAGWVCDLCKALGVEVQVANPNHEAWRWKSVKRKTDRDDALKLAKLSAMDQLPQVKLPSASVRQTRSLIAYRQALVSRRTAVKNSIRSLVERQGLAMPKGRAGWGRESIGVLRGWSRPLAEVGADELWRGQLHVELEALEQAESLCDQVERKLDALAEADERVQRLQTVPGVGPRLAETIVAMIDDPKRFKNGKQIGAYAGLVPAQYESGQSKRQGRITGRGNKLLRALLVEVSWLMRRYNGHFAGIYDRVCRDSRARRKIAVVAVARRLLVTCWAMLRDGSEWRAPLPVAKDQEPKSPPVGV